MFATSNAVAIKTDHLEFTYAELHLLINNRAAEFQSKGLLSGMRVTLFANCDFTTVLNLLTLFHLKCTAIPLREDLPQSEIRKTRAQYHLSKTLEKISDDPKMSPEIATMLFTSGSSGSPKLACHTLANHIASARGSQNIIPLSEGKSWLLSLPLYHVSGISILFRTLLHGATLRITNRPFEKVNHTHISLVSTQAKELLTKNTFSPEVILLGGGPLDEIPKNLRVLRTYGMTEMSSQIYTDDKFVSDVQVKISKQGEILVRGSALFAGYFNEVLTLSDGYFPTGDLGELKNGKLFIHGRKDRMFISGGENIQPEEIESILKKKMSDAAIVPKKCEKFGMRPIAFIDGDISKAEKILATLPKYKRPVAIYHLPKGFSGPKKNLKALQEFAESVQE